MTTYFITRHQGAAQWAEQQGFKIDHVLSHFDPKTTQKQLVALTQNCIVCHRSYKIK